MNIIAMVLLLAMCVLALVVDVAVLVGWLRRRPSTNHRRRLRFERVATIVKRWQRRMKKRNHEIRGQRNRAIKITCGHCG
jgi:hypothetical protein